MAFSCKYNEAKAFATFGADSHHLPSCVSCRRRQCFVANLFFAFFVFYLNTIVLHSLFLLHVFVLHFLILDISRFLDFSKNEVKTISHFFVFLDSFFHFFLIEVDFEKSKKTRNERRFKNTIDF